MIPLDRMGEYTEGIERINVELSLRNKLSWSKRLEERFLAGHLPLGKAEDGEDAPTDDMVERVKAMSLLSEVKSLWGEWLAHLDRKSDAASESYFELLQTDACGLRGSGRSCAPADHLQRRGLHAGGGRMPPHPRKCCAAACGWPCTCMPATATCTPNIPVNSDHYQMLQTAHEAVERIMKLARSLGGVISGEHGIGITKLEFLTDDELRPLPNTSQGRSRRPLQPRQTAARG